MEKKDKPYFQPTSAFTLRFDGLTKRYGAVTALDDVSFDVELGTCHGIAGENGAGKSTLGRILAGVETPDGGRILFGGPLLDHSTPDAARLSGIRMVHQEQPCCPNLSAAENLCLPQIAGSCGPVDFRLLNQTAEQLLESIGAKLDVRRLMGELSVAEQQLVQIAAAVAGSARVVVLDEATSSLTSAEAGKLFQLIQSLRRRGMTFLYITHRLEEIDELCDKVTVLRDGRHVATRLANEVRPKDLIELMTGREVSFAHTAHLAQECTKEAINLERLSSPGAFEDISFTLHRGEILGLAGLVGAGRTEIAEAIFGLRPVSAGTLSVMGRRLGNHSPAEALAAGVGFVPEDRKTCGLAASLNCRENLTLAALDTVSRAGWINVEREKWLAQNCEKQLRIKVPSWEAPVSTLSGGNQQKVVLAKWLVRSCDVLLLDEPTRGVDIASKAEIYEVLDKLACRGYALLLISSDLPELLTICRRILVVRDGRIAGEVLRPDFSERRVLSLMAGASHGG